MTRGDLVSKAVAGAGRTQAELHGLSERVRLLRSFPTHTWGDSYDPSSQL